MDELGYHKIWSQHAPYAIDDYRLLGDNWNYYIEDPAQIELYDVPWCDPIRTHTPDVPCFMNRVAPPGHSCVDQNCQDGQMTQLDTNIHGKFGLYFDTKGHGGDNFQFRASNGYCFIWDMEDCIVSEPPEIFTVWRRIGIDYAWMEDCIASELTEIFTVWRKIYVENAFMDHRGINYPDPDCFR